MMKTVFLGLFGMACASQAAANTISVRVLTDVGRPVADAVVTLKPGGQTSTPPRSSGTIRIEQRDMQFRPFLTVIPVNTTVAFPNFDPTQHHVYSFSAAKRFELKLFARDQQRSVNFDKAGVIAIGCNIHDSMRAYVFVTDTAWTARTDVNGVATFRNTPALATDVTVWHPYLRAPGGMMSRRIAGTQAASNEVFSVKLRPPPLHGMGNY